MGIPPRWLEEWAHVGMVHSQLPNFADGLVIKLGDEIQGTQKDREKLRSLLDDSEVVWFLAMVALGRRVTLSCTLRLWAKHPRECSTDDERADVGLIRDKWRKSINRWLPCLVTFKLISRTTVGQARLRGEKILVPQVEVRVIGENNEPALRKHEVVLVEPKRHEVVIEATDKLDHLLSAITPEVHQKAYELAVACLFETGHPKAHEAIRLLKEIFSEGEKR